VTDPGATGQPLHSSAIDARWLATTPTPVWKIVRDTILRCS
jgi:hypothetical protein